MSLLLEFEYDKIKFSLDVYKFAEYGVYTNGYHGMGMKMVDGAWWTNSPHMSKYINRVITNVEYTKAKARWGLPDKVREHISYARYFLDANLFEVHIDFRKTDPEWLAIQLAAVKTDARIRVAHGINEWIEVEKGGEFDDVWPRDVSL